MSNLSPPAGANEECTAIVEAKHNTLAQSPGPDQVGKTKGDETIDDDVPCENHDYRNTPEAETASHAKQDVPDPGNLVTKNRDSTETQDLINSRPPLTNLKEETYHSPGATKIPNRARDSDIAFNEVPLTELPDNMEHATGTEALQIAQQKVQDDPRHQHSSQGKLSTPGTMDAASYFPRSALELLETPRLSPPPPVANPDDTERVATKSALQLKETPRLGETVKRVKQDVLDTGRKYHQQAVLSYLPDPSQHQGQVQPQLHEVQDPNKQEQVQDLTSARP